MGVLVVFLCCCYFICVFDSLVVSVSVFEVVVVCFSCWCPGFISSTYHSLVSSSSILGCHSPFLKSFGFVYLCQLQLPAAGSFFCSYNCRSARILLASLRFLFSLFLSCVVLLRMYNILVITVCSLFASILCLCLCFSRYSVYRCFRVRAIIMYFDVSMSHVH